MRRTMLIAALARGIVPPAAYAQLDKASAESVESYLDFVDVNAGTTRGGMNAYARAKSDKEVHP